MSQSFPFAQIKFATLEIREWPLRLLRSSAQGVAFHVVPNLSLRRFEILDARTARAVATTRLSRWLEADQPKSVRPCTRMTAFLLAIRDAVRFRQNRRFPSQNGSIETKSDVLKSTISQS